MPNPHEDTGIILTQLNRMTCEKRIHLEVHDDLSVTVRISIYSLVQLSLWEVNNKEALYYFASFFKSLQALSVDFKVRVKTDIDVTSVESIQSVLKAIDELEVCSGTEIESDR